VSTRTALELADPGLLRSGLLVDGQWSAGQNGRETEVVNPATGEPIGAVADATAADVERAIAAAERAFPAWAATPAPARAELLREWCRLVLAAAADLAALLSAEQGKPLAEARAEIVYGAGYLRWYAEEAVRPDGEAIPANARGRRLFALRRPIGVCAAITPWNFPNAMVARKLAPALAAGCTMVLKPASETPFSALALAELGCRAGLPDGVLNVVHGPPQAVGEALTASPVVRKLTFTGSTEVGRLLMRQSAETVKKLSLELGGNAPLLVFDDADLEAAVAGTIAAKFRNGGQTCVCANRILVQAGIYEQFVARLATAVATLRVGGGGEIGPLIDSSALAKVERLLVDAIAHGAQVLTGGRRHRLGGTFFEPTVLRDVDPGSAIAAEEIFGPLAAVTPFETEAEALALANATEAGLAAYLFSADSARIWRVSEALEFGIVGVNTGLVSYEGAPFGGVKQAGLGREGGWQGLAEFQETKYLCLGGLD
jgi:succinate-semialdehyde dehydrogenase/glutarate-semialdehyde dehydrogenase